MTNIIRELHDLQAQVKTMSDTLVTAEFPLERLTVLESQVNLINEKIDLLIHRLGIKFKEKN